MEQYTTNSNSSTEQIVVQAGQIQQQVWSRCALTIPVLELVTERGLVCGYSGEVLGPCQTLQDPPGSHDLCCTGNPCVATWHLFFVKTLEKYIGPL